MLLSTTPGLILLDIPKNVHLNCKPNIVNALEKKEVTSWYIIMENS
jgi:hypothetical protein